jgi:hypothetical protein
MAEEFTLRFPFELSPAREITGIDQPFEQKIGNLTFSWERQDRWYILKVTGFDSELNAKEYANQIWAGLMWVMLNRNVAFSINTDFDKVIYASDPEQAAKNLSKSFGIPIEGRVDGLANGNMPSVYQSDEKIRFVYAGNANLILGNPVGQIFPLLVEGISLANNTSIISDGKLRTALELYQAYYYERSANARFLTLVMALETLTVSSLKSQFVLNIIANWQKDVNLLKNQLESDSEDYEALIALERELLFRREKSLRSQIRALVFDTLQTSDVPDAKELADKAVKVYDKRSTLVHEGTLPVEELNWAEAEAKNIVEVVLRAKFVQAGSVERT